MSLHKDLAKQLMFSTTITANKQTYQHMPSLIMNAEDVKHVLQVNFLVNYHILCAVYGKKNDNQNGLHEIAKECLESVDNYYFK